MQFSIVTPSYRMLDWLRCCVASVRDQADVTVEHLVHDACSDDGTPEWLATQADLTWASEPDEGMYDAINRGLRCARGDILAYLNCDEQYLPGALSNVARFFATHPDIDVVFGDFILAGPGGEFRACRKVVPPSAFLTRVHTTPVGTCATFFRRSVIDRHKLFFDASYRAMGDKLWYLALVRAGVRMALLDSYTSAVGTTGDNLAYSDVARAEGRAYARSVPLPMRMTRPLAKVVFRMRKWRRGSYRQEPFSYAIYTRDHLSARREFQVEHPRFRLAEFR